ncbi:PaaI family thioesterase [Maribellus maritimus]|uniref:PaaI family thioesterase n=1 Tax=Maribellus maritimus TaxID=2870838 RepID=UPI001EEA0A5D|nr:PaaI family thioesterase [Maribellus maritimus]MCG6187758.1 PaaI family thioesterase [Maribellus maritimus]
MKKIKNPFTEKDSSRKEYNCFGCSPFNEMGLKLEFWENGDEIVAKWTPSKSMEGWLGVLHGGIQATLVDELAGWIVLLKKNTSGVTSSLNIDYLKPVYISKGEVTIKGKLTSTEGRIAKIECTLLDGEGKECLHAKADYFCFPEKIAKAKYHYPGIEAFYE